MLAIKGGTLTFLMVGGNYIGDVSHTPSQVLLRPVFSPTTFSITDVCRAGLTPYGL